MTSTIFDIEKNRFTAFYNEHPHLLEDAKNKLLTLIDSILSFRDIMCCSIKTRVKNCDEAIQKLSRKYRDNLEKKH